MTRLRLRVALLGFVFIALFGSVVGAPAHAAATIYTIPGNTVFPEGVAYQPTTSAVFVGSTTDGTVFRGTLADSALQPFLPAGGDGRTSVTGMKVDTLGRLFVSGAATGLIFVYNAATGALIARFDTGSEPKTFINDVIIAPNGDAFFTDSVSPFLYRVYTDTTGKLVEEKFLDFTNTVLTYVAQGFNLNGIVVSPDGQYLVVTQTNTGKLFRITIADKSVAAIDLSGNQLAGDGLILNELTLYAIRVVPGGNGNREFATFTFTDGTYTKATFVSSFTDPSFAYPTTIARAGDRFLVVNSQFDKQTPPATPVLPFTLSSIALPMSAPATTTAATSTTTPAMTTTATTAPATNTAPATTSVAPAETPTPTAAPPGLPNTGAGRQNGAPQSPLLALLGGSVVAAFALLLGAAWATRRKA